MSIFIGDNFMIVSGKYGDAVFNQRGITVALHNHVNDVLLGSTPGCAGLALLMIGG